MEGRRWRGSQHLNVGRRVRWGNAQGRDGVVVVVLALVVGVRRAALNEGSSVRLGE